MYLYQKLYTQGNKLNLLFKDKIASYLFRSKALKNHPDERIAFIMIVNIILWAKSLMMFR